MHSTGPFDNGIPSDRIREYRNSNIRAVLLGGSNGNVQVGYEIAGALELKGIGNGGS